MIPEIPQESHTSGTHRARPQLPCRLSVQAPRATCSPYAECLGSVFLPAALCPPPRSWNAAESCGKHGCPLPCTLQHRCLSWCQHCQKPDRHQSTEQWKSELIYLRKKKTKKPKTCQKEGEASITSSGSSCQDNAKESALYNRERGAAEAAVTSSPARALPAQGHSSPQPPSPSTTIKVQQGEGSQGWNLPRPLPQLLAFPHSPKT